MSTARKHLALSFAELDEADSHFLSDLALPKEEDIEVVTRRLKHAASEDLAAFRSSRDWPSYSVELGLTLNVDGERNATPLTGFATPTKVCNFHPPAVCWVHDMMITRFPLRWIVAMATHGLFATVLLWNASLFAAEAPHEAIHSMLRMLYENGQFNGTTLVAVNGTVVYREAFGEAAGTSTRNTPSTASNLASVSKQFTAMAVMMLMERGKLSCDDPIARHLPALRDVSTGITVRHLLTHTSGIPDVGDLGIDHAGLREDEVFKAVKEQHAQFARPGLKYRYSNTGYMLLAMIVENINQSSFSEFLTANIFKPLSMNSTMLSTPRGSTKGDGGIVSTVDDLLKWDQALYTEDLVKQATLDEAFTPARVQEGTCIYGFGWNVADRDGEKFVWHTGNMGEFRAFVGRRLKTRLFVTILTNKGNSRRTEICDAIMNIIDGKPYALPKLSIALRMAETTQSQGIEAALQEYHHVKASQSDKYDFSESELNSLGYQLLNRGEREAAIRVFGLNTIQFPESSNTYDSLGEAYLKAGKKAEAVRAYKKALELDPNNFNARRVLSSLEPRQPR